MPERCAVYQGAALSSVTPTAVQSMAVSSLTAWSQGQASTGSGGSTGSAPMDSVDAFKQIVDVNVMAVVQAASTINAEGLILPEAYRNEVTV